ncbi:MAG: HlyD family efflux transporter periplasmic adaptor subunit [Woeseia sp.]|nr:HlyD family efflux transporter periplasmic adaptor subunit [Woeseia sp.]MBT8096561.1 HlyD family efflux transporter periplasmic adaptor subunit [Woeseia sp.]NNE61922.1 HlyD family efflux transporter periplasmic adaptor subunit [Woeseia sp.]NNL56012.1 HlyD family efflux transporter periplasmic adaptor subunit [Woeseia sp.]
MRFGILLISVLSAACDSQNNNQIVGQLASDRIELTAEFAEPVIARYAVEGEAVATGQLLLEQDAARIDARLDEAEANIAQQQARLDELTRGPRKEQIDAARAAVDGALKDVEFLSLEYKRAREVFDRKLAAPDTLDRAKSALDAAQSQLDVQQARLAELLTGTTVEELRQAEARLAILRARLSQVERDQRGLRVLAPANAVIDSWLIEVGERPQPGQPVAILLTGEQPYARVYVPEEMRIAVAPGARADILVDGREAPLRGRVRWVATESAFTPFFALTEHDRGRLTFAAKIDIELDGDRLPDGIPVEARIDGATRN